jgi:hypothetical protein
MGDTYGNLGTRTHRQTLLVTSEIFGMRTCPQFQGAETRSMKAVLPAVYSARVAAQAASFSFNAS